MTWLIYPVITTVLYYLGYQATITEPIWRRYPAWLNTWMSCPACIGTWYGAAVAAAYGYGLKLPFLGLPGDRWYTVATVALCSCFWTPLLAYVHLAALRAIQGDPPPGPFDAP